MKAKALFMDRWLFINCFIIYQLLCALPMLYPYLNVFSKVFLLWGIAILFFSIISKKAKREKKLFKYLRFFMVWYFTIIIFHHNFMENFKIYIYMLIQVSVIFCTTEKEDPWRNQKQFISLMKKIVFITFICTFISLCMYLYKYEKIFIYNNTAYILGYVEGRLGGVFGNANIMGVLSGISFFLSMALSRKNPLYIFNSLIQMVSIVLSYSRGSILTILFAFIYAGYSLGFSRYKNTYSKILLFVLCTPIIFMAYYGVDLAAQKAQTLYSRMPEQVAYENKIVQTPDNPVIPKTEEYRGAQTNSARFELLMLGVKVFKGNPLTGVGVMNIGKATEPYLTQYSTYTVDNPILNNPHNTPVQILASSGLIGFLVIGMFAFVFLKKVFARYRRGSSSIFYTYLLALELMLLANSMLEWYIFMNSSVVASIFWLLSSELLVFSPENRIERTSRNE